MGLFLYVSLYSTRSVPASVVEVSERGVFSCAGWVDMTLFIHSLVSTYVTAEKSHKSYKPGFFSASVDHLGLSSNEISRYSTSAVGREREERTRPLH